MNRQVSLRYVLWPLIAALVGFVFLIVSVVLGLSIIQLGTIFTLSFYAGILIFRKIVQQIFAIRHNRRMMGFVRRPVIEVLQERYPEHRRFLNWALRRHVQFDAFRSIVKRRIGITDELWGELILQSLESRPSVIIHAPIYGLATWEIEKLGFSVAESSYPVTRLYFVVNDPHDAEMIAFIEGLIPQLKAISGTDFVLEIEPERGKREAQRTGFLHSLEDGAINILNVDGDTFIDSDAVLNMVRVFEAMPEVACLTGDVRVSNESHNLLTRLTGLRYFYAFNVERAAQSLFGQMTCMSGPFLAIRASVVVEILDDWYNQTFLGERCTYGDDRHMTTLVLALGQKAIFAPDSIVWTDCPTTIPVWRRQQLRWNKSAYRENWLIVAWGILGKLHWSVQFDLFYLTFFPFLVFGVVVSVIARSLSVMLELGLTAGLEILAPYVVAVLAVNFLFQSVYGLILRRDWHYILSPLYAWLYFRHLIWLKLWALVRLRDTGWGTK